MFTIEELNNKVFAGNCLELLKQYPDESIDCLVTSPPYYKKRAYGTNYQIWDGDMSCDHNWEISDKLLQHKICTKCNAWYGELGQEDKPEGYIRHLVQIFAEFHRVMKSTGTMWINIGDTFYSTKFGKHEYLKPKDLIGLPWLLSIALQKRGFYLRNDIIWCLGGNTNLYVRTKDSGDVVMTIKDMARLNPRNLQLWNGKKWTNVLGISKNKKRGDEVNLVLRSGEKIVCTPTHQWPTNRGLLETSNLKVGDIIDSCYLTEPSTKYYPGYMNNEMMWFIGLYLAEGSMSEDTIQISGHTKETEYRINKIIDICKFYGGSFTYDIKGNNLSIRIYSDIIRTILSKHIGGKISTNKYLKNVCWKYSKEWLKILLNGYLDGDGHWEQKNKRWRLGFTRNYNLARDLRTLVARIGNDAKIILNESISKIKEKEYPSFRGEIRFKQSNHVNVKNSNEIVRIEKANKFGYVYDIGVDEDPHTFALASGVLTHNSKPNPMPRSVTDRCTESHEYILFFTKAPIYYFNMDKIREPMITKCYHASKTINHNKDSRTVNIDTDGNISQRLTISSKAMEPDPLGRIKRDVWISNVVGLTKSLHDVKNIGLEFHHAMYSEELITPCVRSGCPEGGIVFDPFMGSGTTAIVALKNKMNYSGTELNGDYLKIIAKRIETVDMDRVNGNSELKDWLIG